MKQGFAATSTDAICTAAGVSKETLYRCYRTKSDLLVDILQQMAIEQSLGDNAKVVWQQALQTGQLEPALTIIAQALIANLMEPTYLGMLRIMLAERYHFPGLEGVFREAIPRRGLASLTELLTQAQAQGLARVEQPELMARFFVGPLLTYLIADGLLAEDNLPKPPSSETISQIVKIFLRLIT